MGANIPCWNNTENIYFMMTMIDKTNCIALSFLLFCVFTFPLTVDASMTVYKEWDTLTTQELSDKGKRFLEHKRNDSALLCYVVVTERYSDNMDKDDMVRCVKAMNNCGCIYYYIYYNFSQAYESLTKALEICERHELNEPLPIIYINLGNLFNEYGRRIFSTVMSQKAVNLYQKGFDFAYKEKDWRSMANAFINLTELNYEMPIDNYDRIFSKEIPETLPCIRYARLQYLAIRHIRRGQYEIARKYLGKQLSIADLGWGLERYNIATYCCISYTYKKEKRYKEAAHFLLKAEQVAQDTHAIDAMAQIYKMLSEIHALSGDTLSSRKYRIDYLECKDSLMNGNRLGSIGEMELIHDFKKEEEKVQQLIQRRKIQNFKLGMVALLLCVIGGFLLVVVKKNRMLKARNKSLFLKNQELIKIEDKERTLRERYEGEQNQNITNVKYGTSRLNEEGKDSLICQIEKVMNSDIICEQDFSISKLAKIVGSNTSYVSQVINEKYGITFSTLLGNSRVREACRKMNDVGQYGKVTLEFISESVGFKSRTTFVNSFKRSVGLTPSEYLRIAQEKQHSKSS